MRILWVSNAPWAATGYGCQTRLTATRLKGLGHEVAVFAFYGLDGAIIEMDGMKVYPDGLRPWGNDVVRGHAQQFGADVVISLMDVWVQDGWGRRMAEDGRVMASWTPVDQTPVPKRVLEQLEGCQALAMSEFGGRELRAAGIEAPVIPHGIDTTTYTPGDQGAARKRARLPEDRWIVGMVAANKGWPSRKCFPEQFLAFSQFAARHPEALLYVHALAAADPVTGGCDLRTLAKACGLRDDQVMFADAYKLVVGGYTDEQMADLYRSMNILSAASMGEGFGIPIVEAQACATPAVTSANTTGWELNFLSAVVEKVHPFWTPLEAWAFVPDVDGLAEQYEVLFEEMQDVRVRARMQSRVRAGAEEYEVERMVRERWRVWLDGLDSSDRSDG